MPRSNFDMKIIRRRARKKLKSKYKKLIKLSEVDDIWKDYVSLLADQLVKRGKVNIDKNASIEIIGKEEIKVIVLKKGGLASTADVNLRRPGLTYKIVYTDTNYRKGSLLFTASKLIKDKVHNALINTNNYYRIIA